MIKPKNNQEQLEQLRHSTAHLLAAAVLEFYPQAKPTIGPAITNGFYYDFDFGSDNISLDDLPKIEQKMKDLVKNWSAFKRVEINELQALTHFKNNPYKQELIKEFAGGDKTITLYTSGDFTDLCRGGHIDNPQKELKHFKLLNLAGAYWRGNEANKMLTRIYGTAFPTKDELQKHLIMLKEAKKRDHRQLGKELDLFVFSDLVGPGLALWTPKGTILRNVLDDFVWKLRRERGYVRVEIPHIAKKELYETSGHWDKFADELFRITTREGHEFAVKPMNCPHHTQIYARQKWSYRELPQRYANTTTCYRDEQTGELHGLSRVRAFTQDDAHVFCRANQVKEEILKIWDIIDIFYKAIGFNLRVRLSFHDPKELDKYLGGEKLWQEAEQAIKNLTKERVADFEEAIGEAAFYGPKIDFVAQDSIGREWQVATIQLDMNLPERFNLTCTAEDGQEERIVMIHAAIMGSIERYLSIVIEHFAGAFPLWLSPIQIQIITVAEKHHQPALNLQQELTAQNIRTEIDAANETVGNKIRKAVGQKIPYILVVGDKEMTGGKLTIRARGSQDQLVMSQDEFIKKITAEINAKKL